MDGKLQMEIFRKAKAEVERLPIQGRAGQQGGRGREGAVYAVGTD